MPSQITDRVWATRPGVSPTVAGNACDYSTALEVVRGSLLDALDDVNLLPPGTQSGTPPFADVNLLGIDTSTSPRTLKKNDGGGNAAANWVDATFGDVFTSDVTNRTRQAQNYAALVALPLADLMGLVDVGEAQGGLFEIVIDSAANVTAALATDPAGGINVALTNGDGTQYARRLYSGSVRPLWFSTVGDGTSNDTANFANLETTIYGQDVDLEGKTHLVDDFPLLNQYYNGSFRTSAETRRLPRNPLSHPLDGAAHVINDDGKTLFNSGPTCELSDGLHVAHTKAWRHGQSNGAPLVIERSTDDGMTLTGPLTLPMDADQRAGFVYGGRNGSNPDRFVICYALTDTGGTRDNVLSYTDGNFEYTHQTFAGTNVAWSSDPVIDDDGFMVFVGYGPGGINYLRTLDGTPGTTSAPAVLRETATTGVTLTETVLVKLGTAKYMMFARNNAGGPGWVSFGTSLSAPDFTPFVESNIPLGANPPAMKVKWGRLYYYLLSRLASQVENERDRVLVASIDIDRLWDLRETLPASDASFSSFLPGRVQLIGALQMSEDLNGRTIGHITDGETNVGGDNPQAGRCIIIGPANRIVQARPKPVSLIRNGDLMRWTRGTSFDLAPNANSQPGPDGAHVYAFGSGTASRVDLPGNIRNLLPTGGRYGLRIQSADAGGFFRQIAYRFRAEDYYRIVGRVCTFQGWFYGQTPPAPSGNGALRVRVQLDPNNGDPVIEPDSTHFSQKELTDSMTELRSTFDVPSDDGITLGPDPIITVIIQANDAGTCDYVYCGGHLVAGTEPPHQVDYRNVDNDAHLTSILFGDNDILGRFEFVGSNSVEKRIFFGETMVREPTVSLIGNAGDFSTNTAGVTATSVTFSGVTRSSALVTFQFAVNPGSGRIVAREPGIGFLIDAEH